MPTFRIPTLVHTRSANAKYLNEISNTHPLWINATDAAALGIGTGDLVRVTTEIGHLVARAWATQAIRPGVAGLSHHMGRWRTTENTGSRWATGLVDVTNDGNGLWRLRYKTHVGPFASDDPDSSRIDWHDPGVHQNLAFAVHPDPLSGMHCWHQKIRIERAHPDDCYGDVVVDTKRSKQIFHDWLAMTRPAPAASGLRRPEFLMRPVKPRRSAFLAPAQPNPKPNTNPQPPGNHG